MLPQDQPLLLQKKPDDDRYDTIIGVLLSFAMVAGVWHFAVKSKPKSTLGHSSHWPASATTVTPPVCDIPAITPAPLLPAPVVNPSVAVEPVPSVVDSAPPRAAIIAKPPHVVQVIKPKPVPPVVKVVKPKPVVIKPLLPPAPVVVEVKPDVVKPVVPVAPPPPVVEPVAPKVIVRESFEFANGSARLPLAAMPRLLEIVELLKTDTRNLKIVGHTDAIGSVRDNHVLSLKRAKAVMRFLINSGVPAEHLTVEGAGADVPIADNSTEEGRKRNRRIEITEAS